MKMKINNDNNDNNENNDNNDNVQMSKMKIIIMKERNIMKYWKK